MKNIDFKKDVLPHLIAVVVFYVVTIAFFTPVILENKVLPQHDINQAAGGSHELNEFYNETGDVTLWTNSMFGGMPTYLMGVKYTGELTVYLHKAMGLFLPQPVRLLFIAFICCYIMLVTMGIRTSLAIAGGIAFGFTDFSIIGLMAGHNAKIAAVAYMPLVFAGIHLAFQGKKLWGFVLTALGLALELRANHLQITYYLLLIVLFYGVATLIQAVKEKTLADFTKTVAILSVAAIIAIGCNLGRIWTVMEYSKYSTRGKTELVSAEKKKSGLARDYAFQYSNGIFEPLFLYIPNFFGGSAQEDLGKDSNLETALKMNGASRQQIKQQVENAPAYWGDQPMTAPYYAGAIVVFLFVLSMLVLDKKDRGWLIAAFAFGILLSWGKNFPVVNNFLFDYMPGLNKFRSVTFTIIIPVFCMIYGGFLALEKLLSTEWNKATQKKFMTAVGIAGGFALLCVLFVGMGSYKGAIDERLASYPEWFLDALRKDRASLLRSDALRSLFFVIAFAAVVWFFVKQKISSVVAGSLMVLLVLIDMFGISKRFINSETFKRKNSSEFVLTDADKRILRDESENYRVLNLMNPFNEATTSYFHSSIGGYHGAKMGRYQDLVSEIISQEHNQVISALQNGSTEFGGIGILNMLNTKYFKFGAEAKAVLPNNLANGNVWFAQDLKRVQSPNEEMETLKYIDTKSTVVVDESKFEIGSFSYDSLSNIRLKSCEPNSLTYESNASVDGLAVFSEIYYPEGWQVTIDGNSVDMIRANYVLRALEVPKGKHEIKFEFRPTSYYTGNTISMVFSVLLMLMLAGAIVKPFVMPSKD